jgi:hypothetical protein
MAGQTIDRHPCCDDTKNAGNSVCTNFYDRGPPMPNIGCSQTVFGCPNLDNSAHMISCYDSNICGNVNGNYVYCYLDTDPSCLHGVLNNRQCGYMAETCNGNQVTVPILSNYVGTLYPPVIGSPMLRGLAPRGLYTTHVDTECGTTESDNRTYFSSTLYNRCLLMYPRPAVASVFARGSSLPANLPYTAAFYDSDYATLFAPYTVDLCDPEITHTYFPFSSPYSGLETEPWRYIFDSAGAMYGNVLDAPTVSLMALWCTNNPDIDICTTVVNTDNVTLYTTDAFTELSYATFIAAVSIGNLRTGIAQTTETPVTVAVNRISFGNTLVSVYNSLHVQSSASVTDWATEAIWDNELANTVTPGTYNLSAALPPWATSEMVTFGTTFDLGVKLGTGVPGGISPLEPTVRTRLDNLPDVFRHALNVANVRSGCTVYGADNYCSTGCTNWNPAGFTVPFYAKGWWCGSAGSGVPPFGLGS